MFNMRIYDCFMYFDEEIVLETRLNYLNPYVDFFVIVESRFTHKGDKRNLKFNIKNFKKFENKIIYLIYDKIPNGIEIVLDNDASGAQTEKHQKRMMGEIAKLTAGSNGSLDPADFDRTVATLLAGGSDPVITKKPEGAWTHEITDAALN